MSCSQPSTALFIHFLNNWTRSTPGCNFGFNVGGWGVEVSTHLWGDMIIG